jgi:proteasome lid subunit RPN8/RPN11
MELRISSQHREQLCNWARLSHPNEVCGLLWGSGEDVHGIEKTDNVAADTTSSFELDPKALLNASRRERGQLQKIIGYFHSHPNDRTEPSSHDADMAAADGRYWLIISGASITAWRAEIAGELFGRFTRIAIECFAEGGA